MYIKKINFLLFFIYNINIYILKGTSLKTLVHSFRLKTLTLYKLFFLEKRVIFFGNKVENICSFQYSLISLFPGIIYIYKYKEKVI